MYYMNGNSYYEGDKQNPDDAEVPQRPSHLHVYQNSEWVIDNVKVVESLKEQLSELEREALMPRGAREAFIVLCLQQGQAAGLNATQLYAANPFYKGLKDTDTIAAGFRAQIRELS